MISSLLPYVLSLLPPPSPNKVVFFAVTAWLIGSLFAPWVGQKVETVSSYLHKSHSAMSTGSSGELKLDDACAFGCARLVYLLYVHAHNLLLDTYLIGNTTVFGIL